MADHFEKFAQVQAKFTSALIYPAMVCCVGVGIIIFFMTFMLPQFMSIFGRVRRSTAVADDACLIGISNCFRILLVADGPASSSWRSFCSSGFRRRRRARGLTNGK